MSTVKVSGRALSLRPAQGHSSYIKLIISICMRVFLVSTIVHASTGEKLELRCDDHNEAAKWVLTFDTGKCSDEQVILVTRVQGSDKDCEDPEDDEDETIFSKVRAACNLKSICETSELKDLSCEMYGCFLVAFQCTSPVSGTTGMPTTDKNNGDRGVSIKDNNNANTTAETSKDSTNMYVVIIVVVSVVAVVAIAFAVTLCLIFFCCQKSPLYRNSTTRRRATQQHQEEYDYVDESKFQVLKPSLGSDARDHGVFSVGPAKATKQQGYQNTITSNDDDYEEISSNESPTPSKRTIQNQKTPPLLTVSLQSELMKSLKSKPGSSRLGDRNNSSPNLQDGHTLQPDAEMPVEDSSTQLNPTSHTSAASSMDRINPDNAEGVDRQGVTSVDLRQGIYTDASSPSPSASTGPAVYHTVVMVNDDYAHLARQREEVRVMENVYDG